MKFDMVAPCWFGAEGPAAFDFKRIGAENVRSEDGRVLFSGDENVLAAANLQSRCAERVLIQLGRFPARTFDELFDGVKAVAWGDLLPVDAAFPVKGSSLSSTLTSVPACQSIVKKAVVEALRRDHKTMVLPETGDEYRVRFTLRKDMAEIQLDTSGDGLHKRGYRRIAGGAPLRETLAATMLDLARVKGDSRIEDPFCGSGTFLIEGAMKAMHMAPGMNRTFAAEHYAFIPERAFRDARAAALAEVDLTAPFEGLGFDIDPGIISLAKANARLAGVEKKCRFAVADVADFIPAPTALVLTNPPYGARMGTEDEAARLAQVLGKRLQSHPVKGAYVITSDAEFETHFGKKAQKRRKLYNGMLPAQVYMYY